MEVRANLSMVFHLDKCIGCHTCSVACKNIWTDRKGAEYMWWNNVETKPGTGYPFLWEDQQKYRGGWELKGNSLSLRLQGRLGGLFNIFFNPYLPHMNDYYEPFTYRYEDLFDTPEGDVQPVARPISMVTGQPMNIDYGPAWEDDFGGSPIYAANDYNLRVLSEAEKRELFEFERVTFFYLPRICNHCLNPGCVAACPAGAIYKRGEDGIVLISQEKCRGWRFCISGCPYKKPYYNWASGKSEKCILCYPRIESGQPPACFHSCVGRIRYLGVLLYDADRIEDAAKAPERDLVEAQRNIILDPFDPGVQKAALANGIPEDWIWAAQRSPVYRFFKKWRVALPLHPEFRTLPMLFYVPPLLPVVGRISGGRFDVTAMEDFFANGENGRLPLRYFARLLAGMNEDLVREAWRKLMAVRVYQRAKDVGDIPENKVRQFLSQAGLSADDAEEMFYMISLPRYQDRFVVPPHSREWPIYEIAPASVTGQPDTWEYKGSTGVGFRRAAQRGA